MGLSRLVSDISIFLIDFRVWCRVLFSDWSISKMNITNLCLNQSERSTEYWRSVIIIFALRLQRPRTRTSDANLKVSIEMFVVNYSHSSFLYENIKQNILAKKVWIHKYWWNTFLLLLWVFFILILRPFKPNQDLWIHTFKMSLYSTSLIDLVFSAEGITFFRIFVSLL